MLASPLLVGALAAGLRPVHLLLGAFWFAGYFAFFAASVWLKSGRRPRHLRPVQVYVALAAVLGAATLAASPGLLRWAPAFAVPLGIGLWSSATRNERALVSGLATTVGSAIMAVVAYDAGGGTSGLRAWTLAAVQAAYFAGTVFYVKSLIRERGSATFLRASIGYHLAPSPPPAPASAGWSSRSWPSSRGAPPRSPGSPPRPRRSRSAWVRSARPSPSRCPAWSHDRYAAPARSHRRP
jgi:hypothetical protein